MMTIEWVIEQAYSGVLRLDLMRSDHHERRGNEGVRAALISKFWDEEGCGIGHIQWAAHAGCTPSVVSFECSTRESEWATFVGDAISKWDDDWRVQSGRLCRIGLLKERRNEPWWHWIALTPANLLIREYLALMEGALNQYRRDDIQGDAWSIQIEAARSLRTLRTNNNEFSSLTAYC